MTWVATNAIVDDYYLYEIVCYKPKFGCMKVLDSHHACTGTLVIELWHVVGMQN